MIYFEITDEGTEVQSMELKVQMKQAGKRDNAIVTAKLLLKKNPSTIKELLANTVKTTHAMHYAKLDKTDAFENGILSEDILLSEEEIDDKASGGKIDFGFLKNEKLISEEEAVKNVLQAFEDGLVAVFIDGNRYESLDNTILLTGKETITFVKLVMLTVRMW